MNEIMKIMKYDTYSRLIPRSKRGIKESLEKAVVDS